MGEDTATPENQPQSLQQQKQPQDRETEALSVTAAKIGNASEETGKMDSAWTVTEEMADIVNRKKKDSHPNSKDRNSGTERGLNHKRVFVSNLLYDVAGDLLSLMREKFGGVP